MGSSEEIETEDSDDGSSEEGTDSEEEDKLSEEGASVVVSLSLVDSDGSVEISLGVGGTSVETDVCSLGAEGSEERAGVAISQDDKAKPAAAIKISKEDLFFIVAPLRREVGLTLKN